MIVNRICADVVTFHIMVDGKPNAPTEAECGWNGTVELIDNESASHRFWSWTCPACGGEHTENDAPTDDPWSDE